MFLCNIIYKKVVTIVMNKNKHIELKYLQCGILSENRERGIYCAYLNMRSSVTHTLGWAEKNRSSILYVTTGIKAFLDTATTNLACAIEYIIVCINVQQILHRVFFINPLRKFFTAMHSPTADRRDHGLSRDGEIFAFA